MKLILSILLLFLSSNIYSQDLTSKYNSLMERYEYFDASGNMIGYKTYNSLMEQWEFTTVKVKRQYEYAPPISTIDLDLIEKTLRAKQKRYNSLSPEQRNRISRRKSYLRKKSFVNSNINIQIDKANKFLKKQRKKRIRNHNRYLKDVNKKEKLNVTKLNDGWYNAFLSLKLYTDLPKLLYKSKIYILNGIPKYYVNKVGMKFDIISSQKKIDNTYNFSYIYDSEVFKDFSFFIIDDKSLLHEPIMYRPGKMFFYTTSSNIKGPISIILKRYDDNSFVYMNDIDSYFKSTPKCSQKKGVSYYILPVGSYRYYAHTNTKLWESEIIIEEGKCSKMNLRSN